MLLTTTSRLFKGTFKALFSDFDAFIRICWAWYALIAVLVVLAALLGISNAAVMALPIALIWIVANASIAVAWHRHLLLQERVGPVNLHVGGRELLYIGKTLLVLLVMLVPLMVLGGFFGLLVAVIGSGSGQVVLPVLVAGALFIFLLLPLIMRLSLILPATALDEKLGIGEAFRDSKGLGLPMALAGVLLTIVVGAIDYGLKAVGAALGEGAITGALAVVILSLALQIAMTALQIGILTGGYYIFRERQMADGPQG